MMKLLDRLRFVMGRKSLYDIYPELATRIPILRSASDSEGASPSGSTAGTDYAQHVWVHKAVSIIAQNIAPLRIQVLDAEGEPIEKHPITDLYEYLNPSMCSADAWQQWAIDMLLWGEHGQEFVKSAGGKYAEVWPRTSTDFAVKIDKSRRNYGGITGYRIQAAGDSYELEPDEFIHYKFFNPENAYRGLAPSRAAALSTLLDKHALTSQLNFFQRGMRPDYAVISEQGLTPREKTEIMSTLEQKHRGPSSEFAPVILEGPITGIEPLGFPPKDAEWVELRNMTREEIGALYGVPDEIMGWGRDTYENFGMAWKVFWTLTLIPLIRVRDNTMSEFFATTSLLQAGQRIVTDLSEVDALQEDKANKIAAGVQLWNTGIPWKNIDEMLGIGLGDFPGKDVGYLQVSMLPVGAEKPAYMQPSGEAAKPEEPAKAVTKAMRIERDGEVHKAMWMLFKQGTETREKGLARIIKKLFQTEQQIVAGMIRDGKTDPDKVFNQPAAVARWVAGTKAYWTETALAGAKHAAEQLGVGVSWTVTNPKVREAIAKLVFDFSKTVVDYSADKLAALLRQSVDEGWGIPQLSDELGELYDEFKGARSERIARTETVKAYNYGAVEQYKEEGVEKKGWLSALDERTRQPPESEFDHWAAHGEEVAIDEPFTQTGEPLMFPGDPDGDPGNIINCRCAVYPIVEV